MSRSLLLVVMVACLAAVVALPAAAKKPKPPPCHPGVFELEGSEETLAIGGEGTVSLAPTCPAVQGKVKAGRKGTKVSAKWGKAVCAGVEKKLKLKAKFDETCQVLTGKVKSKGLKREFVAHRTFAPEGFGAPSLTPELEEDAGLTRTIGPEGGEALHWGDDGTVYRLRVPAGALEAPAAITLTPVVGLGGMPLEGGFVAALDLQPAGLTFGAPATLTITPPGGLPAGRLAGFGWTGSENAFGIAAGWVSADGASFSVSVPHFSGYGMGIPGPSQLDALAGELLALQADTAPFTAQAFACLLSPGGCSAADYETLLVAWLEQVVEPRLNEGGQGPTEALAAHEALKAWLNEAQTHVAENGSATLEALIGLAIGTNLINLATVSDTYRHPACSGDVTDWLDWIRIPQELYARAREIHSEGQTDPLRLAVDDYCAQVAFRDLDFPETLADQETELDLSFRTVVEVAGDADVPLHAAVFLDYGTGASGPDELETDPDGSFATEVSRDPTAPRVSVRIFALHPEIVVLQRRQTVVAGDTAFVFEEHLDAAAASYVPTGGTRELCVRSQVGAPVGAQVAFSIVEPGTLAAASAPLTERDGELFACVEYTAPDGPVGRNLAGVVTATLDHDGETYRDTLDVYPHWVDVLLRADVGAGWENATNRTLAIPGDGPYLIEARAEQADTSLDAPPVPLTGELVFADTATETLRDLGDTCCFLGASGPTDAEGRMSFQWQANGTTETEYPIEVTLGDPDESLVAAGVTLRREVWNLAVSFPNTVEPLDDETLIITVTNAAGTPIPGAFVDIDVTGGSAAQVTGTTNASGVFETTARLHEGETTLTLEIRVYTALGGTLQGSRTVVASVAGELPTVTFLVGTLEFNGQQHHAEVEMTLDPAAGTAALRTCEGLVGCLDFSCDALWEGTVQGDQLTATMVNHNGPCAIGQPGQNRLYGCEITATLSGAPGALRLEGGGNGGFFSCFGNATLPDATFEVCDGGC